MVNKKGGKAASSFKMGHRPSQPQIPAANLPQSKEQLEIVLSALQTPDTRAVQDAEAILNASLKGQTQQCLSWLMELIQTSQQPSTRQMAAVVMRRNLTRLWKSAPANAKDQIKERLLAQLVSEPNRPVMRSIAQLISKLAVDAKKWNQLIPFLVECSKSQNADHREIALLLFSALTENIPNELKTHANKLQTIFVGALNDSDDRVRIAALRALEQLVDLVDPEDQAGVMSLKSIIHPLVNLVISFLNGAASGRDEDVVKSVLHVFDTLSESPIPVLDDYLEDIAKMMIAIIHHRTFDATIHDQANTFLIGLINAKPYKVVKMGLVETLFNLSITLMTASTHEDFDSDEPTSLLMGIDLCSAIISEIPRQHISAYALQTTAKLIASQSPGEQTAGFIALHHMANPMCEELAGPISSIADLILAAVQSPHIGVKRTAWVACGELAENVLQFGDHATRILPVVLRVLSSPNENASVRDKACAALESICEHIDKTVLAQFVPEMMQHLFQLIQSNDLSVISTSVNTVKLLASSKIDNFSQFTSAFVPLFVAMLKTEDDEHLDLRCRATECLGFFAAAVGRESFAPYLEDVTAQVLRGYTLEHFGLRESGYIYFAELATCLNDGIQPLLTNIFTLVLSSLESDDGMELYNRGNGLDEDEEDDYDSAIEDAEDAEDDDENAMRRMTFSLRSGALDEKIAALGCLSMLFDSLGALLQPYVERMFASLEALEEYPHPLVREGALRVYDEVLRWRSRQTPALPAVQRGVCTPIPASDVEMLRQIIHNILVTLEFDDEREVVEVACDVLVNVFQTYGIASIHPEYEKSLHKACLAFLKLKAPCQRPSDDSADDHHDPLTETITDVLPAWANAGGQEFYAKYFGDHLEALLKLTSPSKPADARGAAIGCLGDMTRAMGSAMQQHAGRFVPVVIAGLQDPSVAVRRNAAYAIGELVAVMPQAMEAHFGSIIDVLEKLYHIPADLSAINSESLIQFTNDDYMACRDNACSAISKVIAACCTLGKSTDSRLPQWIALMLQGCPLVNDQQEAKYVYPLILSLYQHYPQLIQAHTPAVLSIFAQMFGHPDVDTEIQRSVIAFCQACSQGENAASVQQCVQQWPQQLQTQWRRFVVENQPVQAATKQ